MASASTSTDRYPLFERLSTTNYRTWVVQMEMILIRHDRLEYVDGTTTCPIPVTPAGSPVGTAPTNAADIFAWKTNDAKARSDLILSLGARQIQLIRSCSTSKEIWDTLKSIYEQSDMASQVAAHTKLMTTRLEEHAPVMSFLEEWQSLLDQASIAGLTFSDSQCVTMLLSLLPPTWRSFVTTQSNIINLTLSQLIDKIMQEDTMCNITSSSSTPPVIAMYVGRSKTNSQVQYKLANIHANNKTRNAMCQSVITVTSWVTLHDNAERKHTMIARKVKCKPILLCFKNKKRRHILIMMSILRQLQHLHLKTITINQMIFYPYFDFIHKML